MTSTLASTGVHAAMLSVYATAVDSARPAVYASQPMTTGLRYVEWRRANPRLVPGTAEYEAGHAEVVAANRAANAPLVAKLRDRFRGRLVVNPADLANVPGWGQEDYLSFWTAVIPTYCATVVFAKGWQYSVGCVTEYAAAVHADIETLDEKLDAGVYEGRAMVAAAVDELAALGDPADGLRAAFARLGGAA